MVSRSSRYTRPQGLRLGVEKLECRRLLVVDLARYQLDTNEDGSITPIDALLVINELNRNGVSRLAEPHPAHLIPLIGEGGSSSFRIDGKTNVTYSVEQPVPSNVDVAITGDKVSISAKTGEVGDDVLTLLATDQSGKQTRTVIPISVELGTGPHAPTARADTATYVQNTPTSIDVLANDNDLDGDPIEVVEVTQPAHGTASIVTIDGTEGADFRVLYVPNVDFSGTDTFQYTIRANGQEASATISLSARSNAAPEVKSPRIDVVKNTPSGVVTKSSLATDSDNDPLTITFSTPANGIISPQGDGWVYVPNVNFVGDDAVSYQVTDGFVTSAGTATFSVGERHFIGPEIRRDEALVAALAVLNVTPGNFEGHSYDDLLPGMYGFSHFEEGKKRNLLDNGFAVGSFCFPARTVTLGETALLVVNSYHLPGSDFVDAALNAHVLTQAQSNRLGDKATKKEFWYAWAHGKNPLLTDEGVIDQIAHDLAALVGDTF